MQHTLDKVQSALPDAQFVGGDVIVHTAGKNVVVGRLLAGEVVDLNDAGEALLPAAAPRTRAPKAAPAAPVVDLTGEE